MRTVIISLCSLCCLSISAQQEHHDWEDNHVLQINREPARAYFIPYGEKAGDRMLSLNGDWKFRWTKTPRSVSKTSSARTTTPQDGKRLLFLPTGKSMATAPPSISLPVILSRLTLPMS